MIKNPLFETLNIEQTVFSSDADSELAEYEENLPVENASAAPEEKDADDVENDRKIDVVYSEAIEAFRTQNGYTEIVEPRYAARNAEVAATFLNIALQAAATKARVKNDRKRVKQFIPNAGGKTVNNVVMANREDILKMLSVDGQVVDPNKT
jgi:hypothetical protein